MEQTKKKKFQAPSAYTALFVIIAVIVVLTWFIPAGHYGVGDAGSIVAGSYERVQQNPQGLRDIFMAPINGMLGVPARGLTKETSAAIPISFFILAVGEFLGIINKAEALDVGIVSVVKKFEGKEKMLILALMLLFALGGSTYGMAEEMIPFYALLTPVMMVVGFDIVIAVATASVGSQVDCLASMANPFVTGVASQAVGTSMGEGIDPQFLMFVILLAVSIIYVYRYASKIEKDPTKSLVYNQRKEDMKHFDIEAIGRQEVIMKKQRHANVLFFITFGIMIISLIPWTALSANLTISESLADWLTNLPVLGTVLSKNMLPLGDWCFLEITILFLAMSIVVAIIYDMKESEFISELLADASDLIGVAIVVVVARGIQVVMDNGLITDTISHWGEQGLSSLSSGVFTTIIFISYIPMSFLIPSTSSLAAVAMGIMGPMGESAGVGKDLVTTAHQSASDLVNLIILISVIVMGAIAIVRFNVPVWWKFTGKLVAILFVAICVVLGTAAMF